MKRNLFLFLLVLSFAACTKASPDLRYYVLVASPEMSPSVAHAGIAARDGPRVGLLPVGLPAYLQRSQMVMREENRVGIRMDDYHRWGEDLGRGINRVLGAVLTSKLEDIRGNAQPLHSGLPVDVRLQLDIRRFEGRVGDVAVIETLWTVQKNDKTVHGGHFIGQREAGADVAALVEAQSALLWDLGVEIAAGLRTLFVHTP